MSAQLNESILECENLLSSSVWRPVSLQVQGTEALIPLAWRLTAPAAGPHTVILGGIHGNELCGVHALRDLLQQFSTGTYTLQSGSLTLAIGSAEAIRAGRRYIEANLNRQFRFDVAPRGSQYERRRAEELKCLLKDNVDFLLDLHATSAPSKPYAMIETPSLLATRVFGFERIVSGWAELGDSSLAGDTQSFVEALGGCAITMENGQMSDPSSTASAIETCRRVLAQRNVQGIEPAIVHKSQIFHMTFVQPLEQPDFTYVKKFENLEALDRGMLIGRDSVKEHFAPTDYDPFMILPANPANLQLGENLFHYGRKLL